jgi:hypothetical protein
MRAGRLVLALFTSLLLLSGVHACAKPVAGGDSESHFLKSCEASCGSGLECHCGVCTRPCSSNGDCSAIARVAECADPDTASCSSPARTCDVLCASDAVCRTMGNGFGCVLGRCRQLDAAGALSSDSGAMQRGTSNVSGGAPSIDASAGAVAQPTNAMMSGGAPLLDASRDTGVLCANKTPPSRIASMGGDVGTQFVVVQSDVDLGDGVPGPIPPARYLNIGFDLDGVCTTSSNSATACARSSNQETSVDGPGGIDNSFGSFIQQIRNFVPDTFSSQAVTAQLKAGVGNLALRVTGYDGSANDDTVQVAMFTTVPLPNWDPSVGTPARPRWDGSDVFPIDSRTVDNGDANAPKAVDTHAYVSGSTLVAVFGSMTQQMVFGLTETIQVRLALHLETSTLVCSISPMDSVPSTSPLACTLAGRWVADDLLHQMAAFPDPTDLNHPQALCTSSQAYQTFKDTICLAADVSDGPDTPPTAPCDALSFGMNFNMLQAQLGGILPGSDVPSSCPAATDPANDSCGL